MKKLLTLLSVILFAGILTAAFLLSASADANGTYTKTGMDSSSETVFYSPYNNSGNAKYDPQNGGTSYKVNNLDYARAYANGTHAFYEFDFLRTEKLLGMTIYLRTKAGNIKVALASISSDGTVKVVGGGAGLPVTEDGWHHLTVEFYETHVLEGGVLTCTLHANAWVDTIRVEEEFTSIETTAIKDSGQFVGLYHVNTGTGAIEALSQDAYCYIYCTNSTKTPLVSVVNNVKEGCGTAPKQVVAPLYYELFGGTLSADRTLTGGFENSVSVSTTTAKHFYVAKTRNGSTLTATVNPIALPADPTHPDGLAFAGWYLDEYYTTEATQQNLAIITDGEPVTLYAKWESLYPVELQDGASIRISDPTGIRFETKVDEIVINELRSSGAPFRVGTLIVPTDRLNGIVPSNFTKQTLTSVGIPFLDITTDFDGVQPEGGYYIFHAVIANVLPENMTRAFSAVSYISVTENGETTYYYGSYDPEKNSRSIWEVAKAAFTDRSAISTGRYTYRIGETFSPYSQGQLTTISSLLDRVIALTHSAGTATQITPAGYSSPYTVTVSGSTLTVSGGDLSKVATIVLNGRPYTGGWVINAGVLTATIPE